MTSKKERKRKEGRGEEGERGEKRDREGRTVEEEEERAGGALQPGDMSARSAEDGTDGACSFPIRLQGISLCGCLRVPCSSGLVSIPFL